MNKGFANIVLILFGLILGAVAVGIFTVWDGFIPTEQEGVSEAIPAEEETDTDQEEVSTPGIDCGIFVASPDSNQTVESPITISGYISNKGSGPCWPAFEGIAGTVRLFDINDIAVTARAPLALTGDWMTTKRVDFQVTLGYQDTPQDIPGYLLFENTYGEGTGLQVLTHTVPVSF